MLDTQDDQQYESQQTVDCIKTGESTGNVSWNCKIIPECWDLCVLWDSVIKVCNYTIKKVYKIDEVVDGILDLARGKCTSPERHSELRRKTSELRERKRVMYEYLQHTK